MAVTTLLGLPIPSMSETVGKTIPDLATAMQMIDQKLGGVRIVGHNLDVASPPNGYYARWENGLQVCVMRHYTPDVNLPVNQQVGQLYRSAFRSWELPAVFKDDQYFASGCYTSRAESRFLWFTGIGDGAFSAGKVTYTWLSPRSTTTGAVGPTLFAIGRWK